MTEMSYRDALKSALHSALASDPRVFLLGEDVGRYGGSYGISKDMLAEFGPERIRDTPLSESAFVGAAIGAAIAGTLPIVEIMTVNFSLLAADQLINNAATLLHMSGGQINVPLVVRMTTGAGRQLAAQHSHSWEGWYAHIPGLKIVTPATVEDARFILAAALADPNPVIIFEHASLFGMKESISAGATNVSLCGAKIMRDGGDLSLITYGGSLPKAMAAASILTSEGIDCEVIDLRALRPLDMETVIKSVSKTSRAIIIDEGWRSVGIGAEISARIAEEAFYYLDAPVIRIATAEVPIPYSRHLEALALPQTSAILTAARRLTLNHDQDSNT